MFREDLHLGLQDGTMQGMIVDSSPAHEFRSRCNSPDSEHQGAAVLTPVVRHLVTGGRRT